MIPPFILPVISFFLGPIGRYVGLALLAAAVVGGIYGKGRYDDHVAYTHKLEAERKDAVQKGNAARNGAVERFDNGRLHDDGFRRD